MEIPALIKKAKDHFYEYDEWEALEMLIGGLLSLSRDNRALTSANEALTALLDERTKP